MGRLGLGLARRRAAARQSHDAAALAYFAAMSVSPNAERRGLLNGLIVGLKVDSVWDKLDWLSIFAVHDAQAARLNARNPARSFVEVGAPVFTADRGYSGSSATGSYLNSGWDPANDGVRYTRNSAHMAVFLQAAASSGNAVGGGNARIIPRNVAGQFVSQANSASVPGHPTAPGTAGLSAWDRSAANAGNQFKDGMAVTTFTTASEPLTGADFHGAGFNNSGNPVPAEAQTRISALCWGGHLTDAEHLALFRRLHAYLAAVGAA